MTIKLEKIYTNDAQSDDNVTLSQVFQYNNPSEKSKKQYYPGTYHQIFLD